MEISSLARCFKLFLNKLTTPYSVATMNMGTCSCDSRTVFLKWDTILDCPFLVVEGMAMIGFPHEKAKHPDEIHLASDPRILIISNGIGTDLSQ